MPPFPDGAPRNPCQREADEPDKSGLASAAGLGPRAELKPWIEPAGLPEPLLPQPGAADAGFGAELFASGVLPPKPRPPGAVLIPGVVIPGFIRAGCPPYGCNALEPRGPLKNRCEFGARAGIE